MYVVEMPLQGLTMTTKPLIRGMVSAFLRGDADDETLFFLCMSLREVFIHIFDMIMEYIPKKETLYLSCVNRSKSLCLLDILEGRTLNSFKQLGNGLGQTGLFTEWLWRFQEYGYPSNPESALSRSELLQKVQGEIAEGIPPLIEAHVWAPASAASAGSRKPAGWA